MGPAPPRRISRSGFLVLLALADGPKHGWAIAREVERYAEGAHLGAGTLYARLKGLRRDGLVEDQGVLERSSPASRRTYRLTAAGREELQREALCVEALTRVARAKRVL